MPLLLSHASVSFASDSECSAHTICPSGLVVYEFLITIGDEIKIIWKRPVTASAVLLSSVRWSLLLAITLRLAPKTPNVSLECLWLRKILKYAFYRSEPGHLRLVRNILLTKTRHIAAQKLVSWTGQSSFLGSSRSHVSLTQPV
ncbi:uncharacterized protein PHACADRAFT_89855 [Phanerochaete carnosa HHB-10118-sp]|uniref:DUF6533 domain-containing protein n=1 Tax=Phanerochaete carnosa (strain HHB-10118-sp) TaxID=650164 RepID=K5X426_PHACS|nr:uncharacterized protein PHACADRAFT_89855 [Phanerochaete carnosa HHB-10118-sp]EKM57587.1 hypothetical protein PHACADRAFT_89855 [Phanerochaete carnosa HHB-10118-sp]